MINISIIILKLWSSYLFHVVNKPLRGYICIAVDGIIELRFHIIRMFSPHLTWNFVQLQENDFSQSRLQTKRTQSDLKPLLGINNPLLPIVSEIRNFHVIVSNTGIFQLQLNAMLDYLFGN